ncbi:NIL domain-containing protein [Microseira sp. BLCC-F43]|jgi:hypothetical protein|uniref:NIL domain-containing protein n=1 Tax=Microseira sp. BLCC-F43 TaxID=3153602 RepID=UPI0035BAEE4D
MEAINYRSLTTGVKLTVVSPVSQSSVTQIRLRVEIPPCYQQEPVISRLIRDHGLIVNITGAKLGQNTGLQGYFDLELRGTQPQICSGLTYLQSLNIKVIGKANPDGDSWHC